MTKLNVLKELAAKVEAGDVRPYEIEEAAIDVWRETKVTKETAWMVLSWTRDAYEGSLDAAKALHEAVLPGWHWEVYDPSSAEVSNDDWAIAEECPDSPARAWLLAILRAMIAQEENK